VEGEFYSAQKLLLTIWLQDGRITGNNPLRNLKLQMLEARLSIEQIKIIERLPIWPFLTSFSDYSPPASACPAQVSCHP
jgi:hypothetical protein